MNQQFVICRYNKNHKVLKSRIILHESKCPDSKGNKLRTCPFNITHKISNEKFDKHLKICPNKPKIEQSLKDEISKYIQSNLDKEECKNNVKFENECFIDIEYFLQNENKNKQNFNCKKKIDIQKFSNQEIFNFMDNGIVDYDEED